MQQAASNVSNSSNTREGFFSRLFSAIRLLVRVAYTIMLLMLLVRTVRGALKRHSKTLKALGDVE